MTTSPAIPALPSELPHPKNYGEGEEMGRSIASLLRPRFILPSSF
jgi:hypothetical protein